jgi:hypothetical protein
MLGLLTKDQEREKNNVEEMRIDFKLKVDKLENEK